MSCFTSLSLSLLNVVGYKQWPTGCWPGLLEDVWTSMAQVTSWSEPREGTV